MDPELLSLLVTRTMPFGKYQGHLIADLPGPYLAWFARKGFPKGELGRLLALMLELDHNGLSSLLDPLRTAPRAWPGQPPGDQPAKPSAAKVAGAKSSAANASGAAAAPKRVAKP
ncbi:hypothetical protein LMG3412_03855 [Achromobacter deleyi]|nr:hypothetical protein LMG3412_03855 [Achromobacter deleyi]